ncbi:MAG: NifB/NifX family molybdenum-iron cluster-binding protein [Caldicoprobacterales bacterium]
MKVAISSTGRDLNSMLDTRFGRCNYFIIYDVEKGFVKAMENRGQISGGGAGIAAAQQIMDEDIDMVITGSMGPNAFNLLRNSDIKVYQCKSIQVEKAIQMLKDGGLEELTQVGPAHAGIGMGSGKGFRGGR